MTRFALALLALALAAGCSSEAPAGSANAAAPAAQAQPAQAPAEPAQYAPRAAEPAGTAQQPVRVAEAAAPAGRFVAGQHYRVLNPAQPTNVPPGKVEVVDVFWYGCGGCFVMYPYMQAWKENMPAAAEYVAMPATLNPGWQPHARLFFATQALGIEDRTHSAIFREYHVNGNPLNTLDLMVEFLQRFDVAEADARAALTGFAVDSQLRAADVRARRYQLGFVPAFVVNGKYVVAVDRDGGPERTLEVINYLVAKEAGAPTG